MEGVLARGIAVLPARPDGGLESARGNALLLSSDALPLLLSAVRLTTKGCMLLSRNRRILVWLHAGQAGRSKSVNGVLMLTNDETAPGRLHSALADAPAR